MVVAVNCCQMGKEGRILETGADVPEHGTFYVLCGSAEMFYVEDVLCGSALKWSMCFWYLKYY